MSQEPGRPPCAHRRRRYSTSCQVSLEQRAVSPAPGDGCLWSPRKAAFDPRLLSAHGSRDVGDIDRSRPLMYKATLTTLYVLLTWRAPSMSCLTATPRGVSRGCADAHASRESLAGRSVGRRGCTSVGYAFPARNQAVNLTHDSCNDPRVAWELVYCTHGAPQHYCSDRKASAVCSSFTCSTLVRLYCSRGPSLPPLHVPHGRVA